MFRVIRLSSFVLGLVILAGCGSSEGTISGEVKVDGQPLKDGTIKFVPSDGKSSPVDAPIKEGKYKATLPPGEVKVEIRGNKVVGKIKMMPESPEVDKVEELVNEKFNTKSDIKMTIQSGSQEKHFDVTGKK